jgi:uncharacterized protein
MRYLTEIIKEFASKKFVFLSGPRQVGKTTLAKEWLQSTPGEYLNWDIESDRADITTKGFLENITSHALVLDEIHKHPRWKSLIKGLFDKRGGSLQVIVTGSARLDVFQKGGDSLLGRYESLRLHPLTLGEVASSLVTPPPRNWLYPEGERSDSHTAGEAFSLWKRLEKRSGFPEPYFENNDLHQTRWSSRRRDILIQEDLRELTKLREIVLIEKLARLLPERVGAPLSINSLREDLQVAHETVSSWLSSLEHLYYCFAISPYDVKNARSLKRQQKYYLWDWTLVPTEGPLFENMVASHLLKAVHAWNDIGYGHYELKYWKNIDKEEVDFIITNYGKPVVCIECKISDIKPTKSFKKLAELLPENTVAVQLVNTDVDDFSKEKLRITSAWNFLKGLP